MSTGRPVVQDASKDDAIQALVEMYENNPGSRPGIKTALRALGFTDWDSLPSIELELTLTVELEAVPDEWIDWDEDADDGVGGMSGIGASRISELVAEALERAGAKVGKYRYADGDDKIGVELT